MNNEQEARVTLWKITVPQIEKDFDEGEAPLWGFMISIPYRPRLLSPPKWV